MTILPGTTPEQAMTIDLLTISAMGGAYIRRRVANTPKIAEPPKKAGWQEMGGKRVYQIGEADDLRNALKSGLL